MEFRAHINSAPCSTVSKNYNVTRPLDCSLENVRLLYSTFSRKLKYLWMLPHDFVIAVVSIYKWMVGQRISQEYLSICVIRNTQWRAFFHSLTSWVSAVRQNALAVFSSLRNAANKLSFFFIVFSLVSLLPNYKPYTKAFQSNQCLLSTTIHLRSSPFKHLWNAHRLSFRHHRTNLNVVCCIYQNRKSANFL